MELQLPSRSPGAAISGVLDLRVRFDVARAILLPGPDRLSLVGLRLLANAKQIQMLESSPPLQDVINVITPKCSAYYHFFLETLPRLIGLPESVWRDSQHQILLPELLYPSQEILLDWLRVPRERIVFLARSEFRRVEGEVINPPQCECYGCNPNLLRNLRRHFFTQTWMAESFPDWDIPFPIQIIQDDRPPDLPGSPEDRLRVNTVFWMQRSGTRRAVVNEAELLEAFRTLIPEARIILHPAEEEDYEVIASRIQASDLIIGPHGAGWSHLIFARPGFRSVEFLAEELPLDMYALLAKAMGSRKHVQLVARGAHDSPLQVDVQEFRAAVLDALRPS